MKMIRLAPGSAKTTFCSIDEGNRSVARAVDGDRRRLYQRSFESSRSQAVVAKLPLRSTKLKD